MKNKKSVHVNGYKRQADAHMKKAFLNLKNRKPYEASEELEKSLKLAVKRDPTEDSAYQIRRIEEAKELAENAAMKASLSAKQKGRKKPEWDDFETENYAAQKSISNYFLGQP